MAAPPSSSRGTKRKRKKPKKTKAKCKKKKKKATVAQHQTQITQGAQQKQMAQHQAVRLMQQQLQAQIIQVRQLQPQQQQPQTEGDSFTHQQLQAQQQQRESKPQTPEIHSSGEDEDDIEPNKPRSRPPPRHGSLLSEYSQCTHHFGSTIATISESGVDKSGAKKGRVEQKEDDTCDNSDSDPSKKEEKGMKVFEAYNNEDIRITFECIGSSCADGTIVHLNVLATFYNKSTEQISDFKFTVKAEAFIKLTIKAANGTKLLASSQNSITQQFESVNTKYGEQPFVIDFEVSFTKDSTEIILKSSVKIPDYFV
eukprot:695723_1